MSNVLIVSAALAVFGPWQTVTPETMHVAVPESVNLSSAYGSVLSRLERKAKASLTNCPILEFGRVVGYRFGDCHEKDNPLSDYLKD